MAKSVIDRNNPAFSFISSASAEEEAPTTGADQHEQKKPTAEDNTRYKLNPEYIEVKSKRVQLVFQPSVKAAAEERASELGISLNEYIHRLIKADTDKKVL